MKIFFSVGEPSGDLHGANLIAALRRRHTDVEAVGYGGPRMAAAGCQLHFELTELAVMGLLRVLLNLHKFLHLAGLADRYFRHHRPDAVVLIDFPGFNWWIARRAKAHGIPVFYYTPPQIWAWAQGRVKKMRRYVDHVLCALPFEQEWFERRGCNATFVGHPYFDEVRQRRLDQAFIERQQAAGRLLTLLPGSRTHEVTDNFPAFLRTAALVQKQVPGVRVAVAAFKPRHAAMARAMAAAQGIDVEIHVGRTPELIEAATCCLAVSGSVSLELLHHARPTVVYYHCGKFWYFLQSIFRRVPFITLVNLLADEDVFDERPQARRQPRLHPESDDVPMPEFVTQSDRSTEVAPMLVRLLNDEAARQARVARLEQLRDKVSSSGASETAAAYILDTLAARRSKLPRPHFRPGMRLASSGGYHAA